MKNVLLFADVSLSYGDRHVFSHLDFSLSPKQTLVIMGASGSGKTSLLRLSAGLLSPTRGRVIKTAKKTAVQFQEPRLLPHLTALENINLVLSDKKSTLPQAFAWLERVELAQAAHLYPSELSGGMAQRVALARALAYGADGGDLYLLDEPFRGLDADLKERMMALVAQETSSASLLLITHDKDVAQYFGQKILFLTP